MASMALLMTSLVLIGSVAYTHSRGCVLNVPKLVLVYSLRCTRTAARYPILLSYIPMKAAVNYCAKESSYEIWFRHFSVRMSDKANPISL